MDGSRAALRDDRIVVVSQADTEWTFHATEDASGRAELHRLHASAEAVSHGDLLRRA